MSGTDENKPGKKKKKHGKRSRKQEQPQKQKLDQLESQGPEQLEGQKPDQVLSEKAEPLQCHEPELLQSQKPDQVLSEKAEPLQCHEPDHLLSEKPEPPASQRPEPQQDSKIQVDVTAASADALSVDFQTLATAYGNYTKKSFEQTKAFVEKLSGVRSLDKAVAIQTEFAKQAYETFVAESQKIRELYRGIAKQNLKPFEGFVAKKKPTAR
jgi:hypothetical protein